MASHWQLPSDGRSSGPRIPKTDYWEIMKMTVIGIHDNSPGQANVKNDSKNPFTQAQNKMKENNKDKHNGKSS